MLFTRNLKQIIENYKNTLSDSAFQSLNKYIYQLTNSIMAELSLKEPGVARGKHVHQLIESEIEKSAHVAVTCHKGCSACCHLEVEITSDDAEVLAQEVVSGLQIDHVRLAELAHREKNDLLWRRPLHAENRCLFLGSDGGCRAYAARPSACRKLSVISEPEECASMDGSPELPRSRRNQCRLSANVALDGRKTPCDRICLQSSFPFRVLLHRR